MTIKMSNSNHITLAQLDKMTAKMVQTIPQDQLVMLVEALAEKAETHKARDAMLRAEVARRYAPLAASLRKADGKDTGTVNVIDGEYQIKANLPKNVEWNQKEMAKGIAEITTWEGTVLSEYVDVKYSIPEARYDAWPTPIKKVFEAARTVKTGTQTFKFEPAKQDAA